MCVSRSRCPFASSSCSAWRRWCWPTQPEASIRTSRWETSWSSKTTSTCQASLATIRWLDPTMRGRREGVDLWLIMPYIWRCTGACCIWFLNLFADRSSLALTLSKPSTCPSSSSSHRFGVRFPCMSDAYDRELQQLAMDVGQELGYGDFLKEGVYCVLGGPSFETIAESRMLHKLGADAVGEQF